VVKIFFDWLNGSGIINNHIFGVFDFLVRIGIFSFLMGCIDGGLFLQVLHKSFCLLAVEQVVVVALEGVFDTIYIHIDLGRLKYLV
jgi:hypothetical protein